MRQDTDTVIRRYERTLFAAAYSVCRNAEDANDTVQDTLLKYHTSAKEFRDEEHLKAWLLRVAINRAKDIVRSFRHRAELPEDYENVTFAEPEDRSLAEAVNALPEKYRIAIHLFYYEDMTAKEIGSVLRISEGSVKMRLSRGRELLRKELKEERI